MKSKKQKSHKKRIVSKSKREAQKNAKMNLNEADTLSTTTSLDVNRPKRVLHLGMNGALYATYEKDLNAGNCSDCDKDQDDLCPRCGEGYNKDEDIHFCG